MTQPYFPNPQNKDDHQWKILKVENHDLWILRGKLEEHSKEISSVALLSPACSIWLSNSFSHWFNIESVLIPHWSITISYYLILFPYQILIPLLFHTAYIISFHSLHVLLHMFFKTSSISDILGFSTYHRFMYYFHISLNLLIITYIGGLLVLMQHNTQHEQFRPCLWGFTLCYALYPITQTIIA